MSSFWLYINDTEKQSEQKRRKIAGWTITLVCVGILVFASAASVECLPRFVIFCKLILQFPRLLFIFLISGLNIS